MHSRYVWRACLFLKESVHHWPFHNLHWKFLPAFSVAGFFLLKKVLNLIQGQLQQVSQKHAFCFSFFLIIVHVPVLHHAIMGTKINIAD